MAEDEITDGNVETSKLCTYIDKLNPKYVPMHRIDKLNLLVIIRAVESCNCSAIKGVIEASGNLYYRGFQNSLTPITPVQNKTSALPNLEIQNPHLH